MKSDFHFHFYSRLVIMAVLAVSVILIQKSVRSDAQISSYPYDVSGWAWAASAGWLSLNCYNDFITPGEYESRCSPSYGLEVNQVGSVLGCAWAGNALNNGGDPLGWVCFSDQLLAQGPSFAVATSSVYLNALDPSTFASILNQENWKCAGGVNTGLGCLKADEAIDCPLSTCVFTDDGAWQLGFPISSQDIKDTNPLEPDLPSQSNPLEGCFNCYEEYTYACSIDANPCTSDSQCPVIGVSPNQQTQTCSVVTAIDYNCDNCLEYFYYLGKCGAGGVGSGTPCKNDDACISPEVCEPISTCYLNIEQDCTNNAASCTGGPINCVPRDIGSLKKLIGAYNCSQCNIESYDNICGINAYQGNINSCAMCEDTFYTPGVMLDNKHFNLAAGETANLCGWGWNAWEDVSAPGTTYGLGWFQFGPRVVTTTRPYLSVEGGNIYAKGNITGRYLPPFGHYNASYLIESSGSITNFISSSTLAGIYQGEFAYRPRINFLQFNTNDFKYSNALGSVDFAGLIGDFSGGSHINKYGSEIISSPAGNISITEPLGGDVYYYSGSSAIPAGGAALEIPAGTPLIPNASGIIIVEGNLTIDKNVVYETGASYSNLKNIPSLVWIVRGDLLIGPSVTNLAGTFIVLGVFGSTTCNPVVATCGQINTCNTATPAECKNNPLTISGNVLAKYFNLGRTYINPSSKEPAEKFINDGHIQANPPPGLEDFGNVIPRFSEN
ncbi:MAG: hypothetical protein WCV71_02910 [Patescibacteria group bacterium]